VAPRRRHAPRLPAIINGVTLEHSFRGVEGNATRVKRLKLDG
jgi:hypothetical protein